MTCAAEAAEIMHRFADRTGLSSGAPQRRYLWTDAFATCNFLDLEATARDPRARREAMALVEAVHRILGSHRDDDSRDGPLNGSDPGQVREHPTLGGLRIGKPLPERAPDAAGDPEDEWDRDGQYFHYLTRWMHALDQMAWFTRYPALNRWARELAAVAFRAFSYVPGPGLPRRMYWKMSIDLSRPLVPAMGHHDPLDGYLTCLQLASSARSLGGERAPDLEEEIGEFATMVTGRRWATADALGLGSLMVDAYRVLQIEQRGRSLPHELLPDLLTDVRQSVEQLARQRDWRLPAARRLPFRELGLVIGIRALERLDEQVPDDDVRRLRQRLGPLTELRVLAHQLLDFWRDPTNQRFDTWRGHEDINDVMLATALSPAGYIELGR